MSATSRFIGQAGMRGRLTSLEGSKPMVRTTASRSRGGPPAVAIVHDYLTQRGGAERVVAVMAEAFPLAPLLTSLYSPDQTFPEFGRAKVRATALNRIPVLRHHHRLALPLLAPIFAAQCVDAEVTLCSSSGWAHGVRAAGRKVVYCYAPARWLYQTERYLGSRGEAAKGSRVVAEITRLMLTGMKPVLSRWDKRAAASADRYLTSSTVVASAIAEVYGIDAEVLPPPPGLRPEGPQEEVPDLPAGYVLCVSRLLPYKNLHHVINAAALLPALRFVIVGDGPLRQALATSATANVRFLGNVDDAQLRWLYSNAAVHLSAAYEDYGLTPLEAGSFGVPTAALEAGGFLDTIFPGLNGLFFAEPTARQIAGTIADCLNERWRRDDICSHASSYSKEQFIWRLQNAVCGCRVTKVQDSPHSGSCHRSSATG